MSAVFGLLSLLCAVCGAFYMGYELGRTKEWLRQFRERLDALDGRGGGSPSTEEREP